MNGHSTFSGCLISLPRRAGFSIFDIWNHICVVSSITLGILGTLAHFPAINGINRHFSGLSGSGDSSGIGSACQGGKELQFYVMKSSFTLRSTVSTKAGYL